MTANPARESKGIPEPRRQPTRRVRRPLLIGGLICLLIFVGSVAELARRVWRVHRTEAPRLYYFLPVEQRSFEFASRPVLIEDLLDADGRGHVRVTYGESSVEIPVSIPVRFANLPGLASHKDWLAVLIMRERDGFDPRDLARADGMRIVVGRCIIVARVQRPGTDPETFGEVFRSDWRFDFWELTDDGRIERFSRLAYPESTRSLNRRQQKARRAGEVIPQRRTDELVPGEWPFYAAMFVMPSGSEPGHLSAPRALAAAGWTLPMATVSLLTSITLIALAIAPGRGRIEERVRASR